MNKLFFYVTIACVILTLLAVLTACRLAGCGECRRTKDTAYVPNDADLLIGQGTTSRGVIVRFYMSADNRRQIVAYSDGRMEIREIKP